MKEMVYNAFEYSCEVLYSGEYKAHKFAILNLGSHPAAYIENKIGVSYESDFRLENINVHCGFTFCETGYWGEESEKISWLGWDYGHYGDFIAYYLQNYSQHQWEKQWTTAEIYEEVKTVIDQIIVVENFDKKGQYKDIINMIKDLDIDYFSNSDKQQICKTLYQKGYRKQSDTAREIMLFLGRGFDEVTGKDFKDLSWYKFFCRELKRRYGVEVEE